MGPSWVTILCLKLMGLRRPLLEWKNLGHSLQKYLFMDDLDGFWSREVESLQTALCQSETYPSGLPYLLLGTCMLVLQQDTYINSKCGAEL